MLFIRLRSLGVRKFSQQYRKGERNDFGNGCIGDFPVWGSVCTTVSVYP